MSYFITESSREQPLYKSGRKKRIDIYPPGVYNDKEQRYPTGVYNYKLAVQEALMADHYPDKDEMICSSCKEETSGASGETYPVCSDKHTDRSDETKKALLTRLKRIEGQVRGLEKMIEKNAYCPDILIQVSAVTSALNSFSRQLLSSHIQGCVKRDIMNGDDAAIDELCQLLQRLMK